MWTFITCRQKISDKSKMRLLHIVLLAFSTSRYTQSFPKASTWGSALSHNSAHGATFFPWVHAVSMRCACGVYAANICQRWKTRKRYPLSRWPWETRREHAGTIRSPTEAANGCHSWFKHWWRNKICIKIYKVSTAKEFPLFWPTSCQADTS